VFLFFDFMASDYYFGIVKPIDRSPLFMLSLQRYHNNNNIKIKLSCFILLAVVYTCDVCIVSQVL